MLTPSPMEPLLDAVEGNAALDAPGRTLGRLVRRGLGSGALKDAISGTWLGNSVHAPLTDAVIGPLLSASLLDLLERDSPRAAQRLVEAGLVVGVPTVVAGFNDWADAEPTDARVRRAGVLHAAGMASGLALYAASAVARRRGDHGRGRGLALAGLGVMMAGSYLGGHLSFRRGVGPNTTAYDRGPTEWTPVDGPPPDAGQPVRVLAGETPVLLVRDGDALHAIHDRCSHRACSLASGAVDGHVVTCPCHGSRFDVRDGALLEGPAAYPQPAFDVRVSGERVEVRRRERT